MKQVGIITLTGYSNYGNRLQCYALQKYCNKNYNMNFVSIKNYPYLNNRLFFISRILKHYIKKGLKRKEQNVEKERNINFLSFEKKIIYYPKTITAFSRLNKFNYIIVGSDQIWNPECGGLKDVDTLNHVKNSKKISYAASFGVSTIEKKYTNRIKKLISKFKAISVRENSGKKLIEDLVGRKDVEVLIDPTMLLEKNEWDEILKRPKQLDIIGNKKYILNYFLGELSEERKKEIEKVARENNCHIINLLDKKDPFYTCGPSEFLYLEKNAFLICTDSFHSSVFAIIYDKPFVIFDREQKGIENMNSRIDTLIEKFELKNRRYNGKNITKENLDHNYTMAYKILENERKKSDKFLKKALDIE